MAQNKPPPMKLYIMSDTIAVVKAHCAERKKEMGVSGARGGNKTILWSRVCSFSLNIYSGVLWDGKSLKVRMEEEEKKKLEHVQAAKRSQAAVMLTSITTGETVAYLVLHLIHQHLNIKWEKETHLHLLLRFTQQALNWHSLWDTTSFLTINSPLGNSFEVTEVTHIPRRLFMSVGRDICSISLMDEMMLKDTRGCKQPGRELFRPAGLDRVNHTNNTSSSQQHVLFLKSPINKPQIRTNHINPNPKNDHCQLTHLYMLGRMAIKSS